MDSDAISSTRGTPEGRASTSQVGAEQGGTIERLARGSTLSIAGAICQQGALFATTAVIGRVLGSRQLGQYALAYALLTIIGLLALCGFRAALTRFIATQLSDDDPAAVRGTIRLCMAISVGSSVLFGVVLFALAPQVASLFHEPSFAGAVRYVAIALPGATLRDSALAATRGWRNQRASVFVAWVYEPLMRLSFTVVALVAGFGLDAAYVALPLGTTTAGLAAVVALRRRMRNVQRVEPRFETRKIMSFSMISWGNTVATTGLLWADTLILGHFRSAGEVGVYTIATRIVTLAIFVMAPIDAAFAPQFAYHFHRGERALLARIYATSTGWILRLSLPAFVVLMVFPSELLRLFGHGYATGSEVTITLAIGQLINAATGPCGNALNMAGKIGINTVNNVAALVLNIALNLLWIPHYGIMGAALAWSLSLGFVNVIKVIELWSISRIQPFGRITFKSLAAAAAAAACGLAIHLWIGPSDVECILGVIVVVAVYIAASLLIGLEAEDRALVSRLRASRVRT